MSRSSPRNVDQGVSAALVASQCCADHRGALILRKSVSALLTLTALAALTACSAQVPPESSAAPTEPAANSGAPEATAEPQGWTAPESCAALDLTPGATLTGTALGECIAAGLISFGSGKEHVDGGTLSGEISFRFDPDFEFQGTVSSNGEPLTMTFIDNVMWVDRGDGPVRGDVSSADLDEQLVGVAGELYRIYSDPTQHADLMSASPAWVVGDSEPLVLGNGETHNGIRVSSAAPFAWNEIPVNEYHVWFAEDRSPLGNRATISMMGITDTTTQTFYDLGEAVEITPVG